MTLKIRKLYNVLVIGGLAAAGCDKAAPAPEKPTTIHKVPDQARPAGDPDEGVAQTKPEVQTVQADEARPVVPAPAASVEPPVATPANPVTKPAPPVPARPAARPAAKPQPAPTVPAAPPAAPGGGARGWH